jgi:hypothetical protein
MVAMSMMDHLEEEDKQKAANTEADLMALGVLPQQQETKLHSPATHQPHDVPGLNSSSGVAPQELPLQHWLDTADPSKDDGLKALGGDLEVAHEAAAVYSEVLESTP